MQKQSQVKHTSARVSLGRRVRTDKHEKETTNFSHIISVSSLRVLHWLLTGHEMIFSNSPSGLSSSE